MRELPHCTMLRHGCNNSNVHFGQFYVIISGVATTPYKATAPDAGNVRGSLSQYLTRRHED